MIGPDDDIVMDGAWPDLFAGYVAYKRASGYRMSRNCQYPVRALSRFLAERPPSECVLDRDAVRDFCQPRPGESSSTQYQRMSLCRQFSLFLRSRGYDSHVLPASHVKRPTDFVPYILTEDEAARLFEAADAMPFNEQSPSTCRVFPALVRILYACGLRLSEALFLTLSDVDIESGVLTVRKAKGNKVRLVPMSESLAEYVRGYWKSMGFDALGGDAWFLPSRGGGRRDRSPVGKKVKQLMLDAGITVDGVNPPRVHDIRHTFAVHSLAKMDEAGVDARCALPLLATYMGHADITSTEYYLRFTELASRSIEGKMAQAYAGVFPEVSHER